MNIKDCYLDVKRLYESNLTDSQINTILDFYRSMMYEYQENRKDIASSYYKTLKKSTFLLDKSDDRIEIINEVLKNE